VGVAPDVIVALLIIANIINIGADIGAMAEWDYAKVYGDDYITRDWEEVIRIRTGERGEEAI
jgi:hypothetical protein